MNLKELRESCGFSRPDVARAMNVSLSAIFKYESGRRYIGLKDVLLLADLFNTSAENVILCQLNSGQNAQ